MRRPTASELSSISIPSAFRSHSTFSKTNFLKRGFGSNEERFYRAQADGIHRQTQGDNATVASGMERDYMPTFLRVKAGKWLRTLNASDASFVT